ncbi:hypothetical protein LZ30DRAFT_341151 [Colletotrichum cereale]|nr:hypothetical protein LZ30DRAFT_341151 [Colletotrichum cereale]
MLYVTGPKRRDPALGHAVVDVPGMATGEAVAVCASPEDGFVFERNPPTIRAPVFQPKEFSAGSNLQGHFRFLVDREQKRLACRPVVQALWSGDVTEGSLLSADVYCSVPQHAIFPHFQSTFCAVFRNPKGRSGAVRLGCPGANADPPRAASVCFPTQDGRTSDNSPPACGF